MKKLLSDPGAWVIGYIVMIAITFGHSYNNFPEGYVNKIMGTEIHHEYGVFEKSVGSFMTAVAWPFYWSVQTQKRH